jgi:polysaccharide pyruvyl transferase CsaB
MVAFSDGISKFGHECVSLSGRPEETSRLYGVQSVPRKDFKRISEEIKLADAVVFPGGSIFQDVTSVRSVVYYHRIVKLAKKANKKVFMVGQGVGPLKTMIGRAFAKQAFNMADLVLVRDATSVTTLKDLGYKGVPRVTADTAFLLTARQRSDDSAEFKVGNMRTVGIAPRPLGKGIDVVGIISDFCRLLFQSGAMPVLIGMDKQEDIPLIQAIEDRAGGKIPDLRKVEGPQEVQSRISRMDSVVAMRLHAGILAATVKIPALMLAYDPKVTAFARQLEIAHPVPLEKLTGARLFEQFEAFQKDRERNVQILERKQAELAKQAAGNVEMIAAALAGNRPSV